MGAGVLTRLLALVTLAVSLIAILALTGPRPDLEVSGVVRRFGGACLLLERWGLMGWTPIGQTYSASDTKNGTWHPVSEDPPCTETVHLEYLVRNPFDAPNGTYRICGLADEQACVMYERVPFQARSDP